MKGYFFHLKYINFSLYFSIHVAGFAVSVELVNSTMSKVIDLYEFLLEAELHQYYSELKNDLKVSSDVVLFKNSAGDFITY